MSIHPLRSASSLQSYRRNRTPPPWNINGHGDDKSSRRLGPKWFQPPDSKASNRCQYRHAQYETGVYIIKPEPRVYAEHVLKSQCARLFRLEAYILTKSPHVCWEPACLLGTRMFAGSSRACCEPACLLGGMIQRLSSYLVILATSVKGHVNCECGCVVMRSQAGLLIRSITHHKVHMSSQLQNVKTTSYHGSANDSLMPATNGQTRSCIDLLAGRAEHQRPC